MKCPECLQNHKYSQGMRCRCTYEFALDPKTDFYTDGRLLSAVKKASANDTLYFTFPQLTTTMAGMRPSLKMDAIFGFVILLVASGIVIGIPDGWFFGLVLAIFGGVGFVKGIRGHGKFDVPQLQRAVKKYQWEKTRFRFLLIDDGPLTEPPPDFAETDLYDYGVEGVLIVERPILVDLFVLNGFHAANRMLVVSQCGYPSYIVSQANQILSQQPNVPVYALHDATPAGASMVTQLKRSGIFELRDHRIVDLGLDTAKLSRTPRLQQFAIDGQVAIDHLKWNRLASGVAASATAGVALIDIIDQDPEAASTKSFG